MIIYTKVLIKETTQSPALDCMFDYCDIDWLPQLCSANPHLQALVESALVDVGRCQEGECKSKKKIIYSEQLGTHAHTDWRLGHIS